MSFYSDASLVMIPSGYKTSKVYCAVPTDGAADLSFSRSNDTATRVGPDGLIEKVRTNLVPNGLLFVSSTGVDYTTITIDSPISGVSSTSITKNEAAGTLRYGIQTCSIPTIASNTTYTISRFFKYDGVNTTTSLESNDGGQWSGTFIQNINIASTGVTLGAPSGCTSKITNVGSGWYRVDVTIAVGTVTVGGPVTYLLQVASALSTGQGFLTAAPQLETSDIATDYILTTSGAVSVGPVANVPRLDYLGSSCPRLNLEPQRVNLFNFSEQIDNAYWTKLNSTITANSVTSPDGYTNADTLTASGSGSVSHLVTRAITTTSGSVYAFSVFAKKGNTDFIALRHDTGGTFNYFNINTGTKGATCDASATIEDYGNGWYRCTVFHTATGGNGGEIYLATANGVVAFAAAGEFAYIYGAQYELGAYATSYIPTLGAAVTRGADAASKTGISSLIGQTEGTLFVDAANLFPSGSRTIALLYTSGSAFYQVYVNASNQVRVDVNGSFIFAGGSIAANTNYKIAFAYKSGEYALYINGAQIATSASTTMPSSLTAYYLGNSIGSEQSGAFSQALLFPTRLSNADLAALTA